MEILTYVKQLKTDILKELNQTTVGTERLYGKLDILNHLIVKMESDLGNIKIGDFLETNKIPTIITRDGYGNIIKSEPLCDGRDNSAPFKVVKIIKKESEKAIIGKFGNHFAKIALNSNKTLEDNGIFKSSEYAYDRVYEVRF